MPLKMEYSDIGSTLPSNTHPQDDLVDPRPVGLQYASQVGADGEPVTVQFPSRHAYPRDCYAYRRIERFIPRASLLPQFVSSVCRGGNRGVRRHVVGRQTGSPKYSLPFLSSYSSATQPSDPNKCRTPSQSVRVLAAAAAGGRVC